MWLRDSDLAIDAFRSLDYDGVNYDLQMAAVSAFVGDPSENQGVDQLSWDTFFHSVLWSPFRLFASESKEGIHDSIYKVILSFKPLLPLLCYKKRHGFGYSSEEKKLSKLTYIYTYLTTRRYPAKSI